MIERVRITQHAQIELVDDAISLDGVLAALRNGLVLENFPDPRRGACCLIYDKDFSRRDVRVVFTTAKTPLYHHHRRFAVAAEMGFRNAPSGQTMKCSMASCPGEYESTTVIHTVRSNGRVLVIDYVPAEICTVCGEVLFSPETVRHIEGLLADLPEPSQKVPLFEYA